jgi:hypothetical protein
MDKITPEIISFANIGEDETIVFHKKLSSNLVFYKNDKRKLRKHLIITKSNLIFIDYQSFLFFKPKGCRERDVIPLTEIEVVSCDMREVFMAKRPFLELTTTRKDVYGIALSGIGKYKEEITDIANLIKASNPQAEIKI